MKRFISIFVICMLFAALFASCGKEKEPNEAFSATLQDGTVLYTEMDKSIIDQLGEPVESLEAETCLEDGKEYYYSYEDFSITTNSTTVIVVKVFSADINVSGIHVGMTVDELTSAWGEGSDNSEFILYKRSGSTCLCYIEGDQVASIVLM